MCFPLWNSCADTSAAGVEYTIDGETLNVDCLMCAICNGRTYGGGFCAAPEAQPDDGWLDVYIIRKVSRCDHCKAAGNVQERQHFQNGQLVRAAEPYFIYRRAKQVSLARCGWPWADRCHGRR